MDYTRAKESFKESLDRIPVTEVEKERTLLFLWNLNIGLFHLTESLASELSEIRADLSEIRAELSEIRADLSRRPRPIK
jgi:hypothetical protein